MNNPYNPGFNIPGGIDPSVTTQTQGFPLGAVMSGASSLLGGLFNIGASRRQNKRMVDFWNMQNEYNHPSAQMERLREAGLNPNLIYGSGAQSATGNAGDVGSPQAEKYDGPNPIEVGLNYQRQKLQTDNLRAMNTNLLREAELKSAQALKTIADAGISDARKRVLTRTIEDQIQKLQADSNYSFNRAEMMWQEMDSKRLTSNQRLLLRNKFYQSILDKYQKIGIDKDNAGKLGVLRDAQAELQRLNIDFFTANAVTNLLAKIFGIKFFR